LSSPQAQSGPLVSIVVPFLDPGPFLHEAIVSALVQTYANWELLLVDDGSSDGSDAVARSYAEPVDGRIKYVAPPEARPSGMSATRNRGIAAAGGELIAFLDADDTMSRRRLDDQVAILSAHERAAMVYGPTEWWYSWTGDAADRGRDFIQSLGFAPNRLFEPPSLLAHLLRREHPTMTPALVRRDALADVGAFEDSFAGLYEDQAACAKICSRYAVFVSGECWYRWRQHPRSSCAVAAVSGTHAAARDAYLQWLSGFLEQEQVDDADVADTLRAELDKLDRPAPEPATPLARRVARRVVPAGARRALRRRRLRANAPGIVDVTALESPVSRAWGYDRGTPIDRVYIETFLGENAADIHGRVLEAGDDTYTRRFGGTQVTHADVLHVSDDSPKATFVADLAAAPALPSDTFDCIVLTQTLQFIQDVDAAVATLHRILAPAGVVLATMPGISHMGEDEWLETWRWRFTANSARELFADAFGSENVSVTTYGNVATSVGFLCGFAAEELPRSQFLEHDPSYDVIVAVRAAKSR
jgi:hypothetical protein